VAWAIVLARWLTARERTHSIPSRWLTARYNQPIEVGFMGV